MRERPILFSGPMVRAILDGRKTMTRRVVKPVPSDVWGHGVVTDTRSTKFGKFCVHMRGEFCGDVHVDCPYGAPGDRLWVRETFAPMEPIMSPPEMQGGVLYRASWSYENTEPIWKPSIFMPRRASRITLEIAGVRVERLREISLGDAMGEGCPFPNMADGDDPRQWFADLWKSINGADTWDANPWVWVVMFRRV